MGTKNNPGKFDCYEKALPDEPVFVVLARDPEFARLVRNWAESRSRAIACGDRPETDGGMVLEAYDVATRGERWRKENNGAWREVAQPRAPAESELDVDISDLVAQADASIATTRATRDFIRRVFTTEAIHALRAVRKKT